jgi:DNA invertase Pin-like site-specific DNA recombinase
MQTARVSAPSPHVRAALYARVSTDMQTERFGLALQLHECRVEPYKGTKSFIESVN